MIENRLEREDKRANPMLSTRVVETKMVVFIVKDILLNFRRFYKFILHPIQDPSNTIKESSLYSRLRQEVPMRGKLYLKQRFSLMLDISYLCYFKHNGLFAKIIFIPGSPDNSTIPF